MSKHEQAHIPTTIYQNITEKILKKPHFVLAILGVFVPSKLLIPPSCVESCYKNTRLYVNINKHKFQLDLSRYCQKNGEKDIFCICNFGPWFCCPRSYLALKV